MGIRGSRRKPAVLVGLVVLIGATVLAFVLSPRYWGKDAAEQLQSDSATSAQLVDSDIAIKINTHLKTAAPLASAKYVGTAACSPCHQTQATAHRGSHHDRAIEVPTEQTVLAPFQGESFAHDKSRSTFLRKGSDYFIHTIGPGGKEADYRVAYTFGFTPLQQYLLDLGGGRLQAFTVAWDARSKAEGGQKYFDLYPAEDLSPDDELHWSRGVQNWNFTCADCHTTALSKGYDEQKNSFALSYGELDVGCEACHGPGSNHLSWATPQGGKSDSVDQNKGLVVSLKQAQNWNINSGNRSATPHSAEDSQLEIETCAPCHSRRQQLREGRTPDQPFMDAYSPELLQQGLYFPDGQIQDEVYVYGSFMQSRMHHAGVRCSDCHEPHSLSLRREGNALCSGCHGAAVFDSPAHHHHEESSLGAACVNCHMPETTYMQIDPRRDHSLRIPRPDLGSVTGAPDACTKCHQSKSQSWAASKIDSWFGDKRRPHYGPTFTAARLSNPEALPQLTALIRASDQPAIVRGTALLLLANYPGPESMTLLKENAKSREALVRLGVTRGSVGLAPAERLELLRPLLSDALLSVRTEATRALVGIPREAVPPSYREEWERALKELRQTERFYADRPDSWLRIGLLELGRGDSKAAHAALRKALDLDPRFVPALVNLADLERMAGQEAESQLLLRRALGIDESNAEAWHALGLSLVRSKERDLALPMFERAIKLRPENPRFFYVYAIALADGGGDLTKALRVLQEGLVHHPHDHNLLQLLMNFARQAGDQQLASEAAARLAGLGALLGQ